MLYRFIAVVLILLSFNAYAIQITVGDNIEGTVLVAPGSSVSGQFDINPAIPSSGYYTTPYDVTSARATFIFTDDFDPLRYTSSTTYSYYFDHGRYTSADSTDYWYRNRINYYRDDADTVRVSVDGQVSVDGTNWYRDPNYYTGTTYDGGGQTGTYCDGWNFFGYCTDTDYYYDYYYTRNYSSESDILYLDGKLSADIEESVAVSVPEPSSFLLCVLGLAGLVVTRHRKYF
ncbi:MAG: hypothetical protein AMJ53_18765 [Gammaproteobacteria bacterium SG8_11]|nr:MAG: hypothetical protein AMJ53_18765 [Gammaproteobacteria bacterium SG8_11]